MKTEYSSRMTLLGLAAILLMFLARGAAQDSRQLPDAPSPSRGAETKETPQKKNRRSTFSILAQRSRFFPDLAHSDKPLKTGDKLRLFVRSSVSPASFVGSAFSAGIGQASDSPSGYGQGGAGYGKRFGSAMATGASTSFFGNFVLPSLLHQDPRFFPTSDSSFRHNARHALQRIVITRTDRGAETFNWSGMVAPLAAQGIANSYLPQEQRTAGATFSRYASDIGSTAGLNFLKGYWPAIAKRMKKIYHKK